MQPRVKRRRAIGAVLLVVFSLGAAAGVSGCAPEEGTTSSPPPSPTTAISTPVLPSNEEALAIVEELVPAAIAAETRAGATGDFADLETLAGSDYVAEARAGAEALSAQALKVTGDVRVDSLVVQSVNREDEFIVIASYGCYDISATQLVDASGTNTRSRDVPVRVPVVFRVQTDPASYKLMETSPWSGSDTC